MVTFQLLWNVFIFYHEYEKYISKLIFKREVLFLLIYFKPVISNTEEMGEEFKSFKNKKKSLVRRGASKIKSIIKGLYESN